MLDIHAAIDRALAAAPDFTYGLSVNCGECAARVPFHSDTDIRILAKCCSLSGCCIFAGHSICRLPVSVRRGPAGSVGSCSSCGLRERAEPGDTSLALKWAMGCPRCGAGAVAALLVPLKEAAFLLGKSNKTILRWAASCDARSLVGRQWLIDVEKLRGGTAKRPS